MKLFLPIVPTFSNFFWILHIKLSYIYYWYCKEIYSNLDYIYTPSLTREYNTIRTEPWVHAYTKRELTLIRSVNSRLFDTWIHAYSMREFTLIRCVNVRLYGALIHAYSIHEPTLFNAWIYAYSMLECTLVLRVNYHLYGCEVMSEDSEDLAFLNHVISRDQNISCNHSPLPRPGCD